MQMQPVTIEPWTLVASVFTIAGLFVAMVWILHRSVKQDFIGAIQTLRAEVINQRETFQKAINELHSRINELRDRVNQNEVDLAYQKGRKDGAEAVLHAQERASG